GKLQTIGDARPIAEQVDYYTGNSSGNFSASSTGVLVYSSGLVGTNSQLTWFDRSGKQLGTVGPAAEGEWAFLSPDGSAIAYVQRDEETGLFDVWIYDLKRQTDSRFTFGPNNNQFPVWSGDGSRIAFAATRDGHTNIYQKAATGPAQDEPLDKDEREKRV